MIKAERVITCIVKELEKIDALVSLIYGTMLHEYRNGTGPCVQANFNDKDFDIAVFREHFTYIVGILDDIQKQFGWKKLFINEERLVMILVAPGQKKQV